MSRYVKWTLLRTHPLCEFANQATLSCLIPAAQNKLCHHQAKKNKEESKTVAQFKRFIGGSGTHGVST